MLELKNISKQYRTGDEVQTTLDQVSLTFSDREFVSILGASGSGKTTSISSVAWILMTAETCLSMAHPPSPLKNKIGMPIGIGLLALSSKVTT